jgi:putative Holliday junction resolvase
MDPIFNFLGLDVGKARVGMAIANSVAKIANPLQTVDFNDQLINKIAEIIDHNQIDYIVVGLPRGLNGTDTQQTKWLLDFYNKLKGSVKVKTFLEDEALSSVRATEALKSKNKVYNKSDIDSVAACYILEDFFNNNYPGRLND